MKDNKKRIVWEALSQEEKQGYLAFWFNYYGSELYTLKEYEDFLKIAKSKADEIYAYICTSFLFANTIQSTILLKAMRENKVDDLFKANITEDKIKDFKIDDSEKTELLSDLEEVRTMIIGEIVKSFNNPEPSDYTIAIVPELR